MPKYLPESRVRCNEINSFAGKKSFRLALSNSRMDWVTRNCVGLSIITNTNYPNRSFVLLPWLAHAWQQICRAKSVVFKIALTAFRLAIANLKTPRVSRSCEPEYH